MLVSALIVKNYKVVEKNVLGTSFVCSEDFLTADVKNDIFKN